MRPVKADFVSSQKLLAAILLQKKSVMQVLAANILMRSFIVKIVCKCFLPPDGKAGLSVLVVAILPQLSKCQKCEAVWVYLLIK